jgi:hypothetical protein
VTPAEMANSFRSTENIDRAIDVLFRWFDAQMSVGNWDRVNEGFALMDFEYMCEDRIVAVCSVSGWRARVDRVAHDALMVRAHTRLLELVGPETATKLTTGWM